MSNSVKKTKEHCLSLIVPLIVVFITFAVFLPSLSNDFVDWDDDKVLINNPYYRGLGLTNLNWMFTTFHVGHYHPFSWISLSIDYLLWGMDPFGYHLTSLLLHIANTVVYYFLTLLILKITIPCSNKRSTELEHFFAGVVALLFSIHPLRVESVAWVTERRDVLSGLFFLLSLFTYLRTKISLKDKSRQRLWMAVSLILFTMSLFSKAITVTLPVILLLLDVYPLKRLGGGSGKWFGKEVRNIWIEKVPFFLLAFVFSIVALFAQSHTGDVISLEEHNIISRLSQAFYGLAFYLFKTLVPLGLLPLYDLIPPISQLQWRFVVSFVVVLVLTLTLIKVRRRWPSGLATWVFYVVVLSPVLGFFQSGPQFVADRYTYLSCLGYPLLAGAGMLHFWRLSKVGINKQFSKIFVCMAFVLPVVLISTLGILTWRQTQVWSSSILWKYTLERAPDCAIAHNNLGLSLANKGKLDEAIEHYYKAININPSLAGAHNNLGMAFAKQDRLDKAIEHYKEALKLQPEYGEAYNNLGHALADKGEFDEAIKHYQQAIRIKPILGGAYDNLGMAFASQGKIDKAIEHYQQAININPSYAEAHNNLGMAFASQGKIDKAIEHYQQAININPSYALAHYNLGNLFLNQGKSDYAINHYQQAIRIKPNFVEAHNNLGAVLVDKGKLDEAIEHYQVALKLNPNNAETRNNIDVVMELLKKQQQSGHQ